MHGALLAVVLTLAPVQTTERWMQLPTRSVLRPVVEILLIDLAILGFDRFVLNESFARVTPESIARNLRGGWEFDSDNLWVNFLGHPFHGSLIFNAARGSGLSFWESVPFALAHSFLWEIAGEVGPPSISDLVVTTVAGALWGESMHRLAGILMEGPEPPGVLGVIGAALLDPVGSFNREVFGRPEFAPISQPPFFGNVRAGASLVRQSPETSAQGFFGVELTYGFPDERAEPFRKAMDHFDLAANVAFVGTLRMNFSLRGLLVGTALTSSSGAWGLFGLQDFLSANTFRLGATSLGPGLAWGRAVGSSLQARASVIASGVAIGATGTFDQVDPNLGGDLPRYAFGPGAAGTLDASLEHETLGRLRVVARAYAIASLTTATGWERIEMVLARADVWLPLRQALGVEVQLAARQNDRQPRAPAELLGHLYWSFRFGQASP